MNANNRAILNLEIESLLQKAVIEPVPFAQRLKGFYSTFFLVLKKLGDLRAVINLRPLNQYLKNSTFQDGYSEDCSKSSQERTLGNINGLERCLFPHVNSPKTQEISSFLHSGQSISVPSTGFWSKNLARVFTKIVAVAAAHLRMQIIRLAVYLDDWLALNARRRFLLKNREVILSFLSRLGYLINKKKSNLVPTQDIIYIRGRHCLDKGIVMPTPERIVKLRSAVISLLGEKVSARQYLQTLGLIASCIEIIPNARLQMRPIQLHSLYWWKPVSRDLEMTIPESHHLKEHPSWWLQEANIDKSRSLSQIQASIIIATE